MDRSGRDRDPAVPSGDGGVKSAADFVGAAVQDNRGGGCRHLVACPLDRWRQGDVNIRIAGGGERPGDVERDRRIRANGPVAAIDESNEGVGLHAFAPRMMGASCPIEPLPFVIWR